MTVVETPGFLREAATALTDDERTEVISFLAANPEAGGIMPDQRLAAAESCVGGDRDATSRPVCG